MSERFHVTDVNPNDEIGGGGCVCSDSKAPDCKAPFVVFYATETDSNLSPHVVACATCIESAYAATEAFADDVVDADVDEDKDIPRV